MISPELFHKFLSFFHIAELLQPNLALLSASISEICLFCQFFIGSCWSFCHQFVQSNDTLMISPEHFHKFLSFISYCRTITAEFGSFVRIDFPDMSFCQIVVGSFWSFGHVKLICKLMNSPKFFHKFLFFSYCRTITAKFGSFVCIDFRDMFRIEPIIQFCSICEFVIGSYWSFGHVKSNDTLMISPEVFHKFLFFFILQNYYSQIWLFCSHRFPRYVSDRADYIVLFNL